MSKNNKELINDIKKIIEHLEVCSFCPIYKFGEEHNFEEQRIFGKCFKGFSGCVLRIVVILNKEYNISLNQSISFYKDFCKEKELPLTDGDDSYCLTCQSHRSYNCLKFFLFVLEKIKKNYLELE